MVGKAQKAAEFALLFSTKQLARTMIAGHGSRAQGIPAFAHYSGKLPVRTEGTPAQYPGKLPVRTTCVSQQYPVNRGKRKSADSAHKAYIDKKMVKNEQDLKFFLQTDEGRKWQRNGPARFEFGYRQNDAIFYASSTDEGMVLTEDALNLRCFELDGFEEGAAKEIPYVLPPRGLTYDLVCIAVDHGSHRHGGGVRLEP